MRKPFFFAAGYICTYLLRYFSLPRSFMKREIVLNWNVFVTTTRPANWKSIFRLRIVSPVPSPQQLSSFSAHSTLKHSSVGASFLPALTPFLLYSANKVIKTEQTNNAPGSSARGTNTQKTMFLKKTKGSVDPVLHLVIPNTHLHFLSVSLYNMKL